MLHEELQKESAHIFKNKFASVENFNIISSHETMLSVDRYWHVHTIFPVSMHL